MRVVVIPSDLGACCFYRAAWPSQYVIKETGWKVELYKPDSVGLESPGMIIRGIPDIESVDLVVLQRLAAARQFEFVVTLQAMGIAVVVDVDDALWRIDPDNSSHRRWTEVVDGWPRFEHLDAACAVADRVTVSTPLLAKRYGAHGRVDVLRNGLPNVAFADNVKTGFQERIKIGWAGSLESHPNDLQVMGDAVARVIQENDDVDLHIVGDAGPIADMLGIPKDVQFSRRVSGTGWVPLDQYHAALRDIDIMVVPLADTAFNRAKCVDSSMRICTRRGFIPAGEIIVGDQVWRDGWKEVQAVEHGDIVTGVRVTTERGYALDLTENHRMMVDGSWVEAGNIAPGSVMEMSAEAIGARADVEVNWPSESRMSRSADADHYAFVEAKDAPRIAITPRWGRFLGAYVGDGSLNGKSQVQISCDGADQDWIDTIMDDIREFGMSPSTERIVTFDGQVLRRRGVRFASAHLVRVLKEMGLARDRENGKPIRVTRVPEVIWNSPRRVVAEFLAGYYEADGTTTSSGVDIVSKDGDLARDVQRLLLQFGITSRLSSRKHRAQNGFAAFYWHVTFGRAGADIFEKEIGFRSERKRARLASITGRGHSNAYRPMRWEDKVVSVEPIEVDPVDIQVEGSEFIAAGFVSHNSSLKAQEGAAAGSVVLASATPENERLYGLGGFTGGIVRGDDGSTWHRSLSDMVELTRNGGWVRPGPTQARFLAYERRGMEWATAWEEAVRHRKGHK